MAAAATSYYAAFCGPGAGSAGARRSGRGGRLRHRRRHRRLLHCAASRRARLPGRPPRSTADRLRRLRPQRRPGDRGLRLRPAQARAAGRLRECPADVGHLCRRPAADPRSRRAARDRLRSALGSVARRDQGAPARGSAGRATATWRIATAIGSCDSWSAPRWSRLLATKRYCAGTLRRRQRAPSSAELHARPGRGGRSGGRTDLRELSRHGPAYRRPCHRRAPNVAACGRDSSRCAATPTASRSSLHYARGSCRWGLTSSPPNRSARRGSKS